MTGDLGHVPALELLNTLLVRDGRLTLFDVFGHQQLELVVSDGAITRFWFNWHPCVEADVVAGFIATFGAIRGGCFKLRHRLDLELRSAKAKAAPGKHGLRVPLFGAVLTAAELKDSRFDSATLSAKRGSDDALSRWRIARQLVPRESRLQDHLRSFLTLAGPNLRSAPTLLELCRALQADLDWVRVCLHALEDCGALERVAVSNLVASDYALAGD